MESPHEATVAPPGPAPVSVLEAVSRLHAASGLLSQQAMLLGRLAHTEWEEEKVRLLKMLLLLLLSFACLLCVMLFVGVLALGLSWQTAYSLPVAVVLIALYSFGLHLAWRRFQQLSALGSSTFAATRAELAADLALLRSKL